MMNYSLSCLSSKHLKTPLFNDYCAFSRYTLSINKFFSCFSSSSVLNLQRSCIVSNSCFKKILNSAILINNNKFINNAIDTVISGVFFQDMLSGDGGAVVSLNKNNNLEIIKCYFIRCSASNGGAIFCECNETLIRMTCFEGCFASNIGQAIYSTSNQISLTLITTLMCSPSFKMGYMCAIHTYCPIVCFSNLNESYNYLSHHTGCFRIGSTTRTNVSFFQLFECLSSLGATLNFQHDPSEYCTLRYGNVINCPVRTTYYLIWFDSGHEKGIFEYTSFINTTGAQLIHGHITGGTPSFKYCVFDMSENCIAGCYYHSCGFQQTYYQSLGYLLNTGNCFGNYQENTQRYIITRNIKVFASVFIYMF